MRAPAGLLSVMLVLSPGAARAKEPRRLSPCEGPSITVPSSLARDRAWARAASAAEVELARLDDVDPCSRVELERTDRAVRLTVREQDGRSVTRVLSGPEELESAAVAVLVLPPPRIAAATEAEAEDTASTSEKAVPAAAPPATRRSGLTARALPPRRDDGVVQSARSPTSGLELGAGAFSRMSGALAGPGGALLIDFRTGSWFVGTSARGDSLYSTRAPSAAGVTRQLGFSMAPSVGRAILDGTLRLDVGVELPVAARRSTFLRQPSAIGSVRELDEPEVEPDDDDVVPSGGAAPVPVEVRAWDFDLRAGAFVRATLPFGSTLRAFAALGVDRSVGIVRRPASVPESPAWSADLTLGVLMGPL